jgi:hypothetical protein
MPGRNSEKDRSMAADLKKRGVRRTTSQCPWGCGRAISNGGGPLIAHLGTCRGPFRGHGKKAALKAARGEA